MRRFALLGISMGAAIAVAHAARHPEKGDTEEPAVPLRLTPRQAEVLRAIAAGLTDKQVACQLPLSPRTVEMHVAGALKALACATRAEAVFRATEAKLLAA